MSRSFGPYHSLAEFTGRTVTFPDMLRELAKIPRRDVIRWIVGLSERLEQKEADKPRRWAISRCQKHPPNPPPVQRRRKRLRCTGGAFHAALGDFRCHPLATALHPRNAKTLAGARVLTLFVASCRQLAKWRRRELNPRPTLT